MSKQHRSRAMEQGGNTVNRSSAPESTQLNYPTIHYLQAMKLELVGHQRFTSEQPLCQHALKWLANEVTGPYPTEPSSRCQYDFSFLEQPRCIL